MYRISVDDVEHIAFQLARERFSYGEPIPDFTTRYPNILESCLAAPFQTFGKKDLYPTDNEKISVLFYLMNKNHPFENGNKRIAMTTLFYALYRQKKWLRVDTQKLYNFAVWVASSPAEAKQEVINFIIRFLKDNQISWDEA